MAAVNNGVAPIPAPKFLRTFFFCSSMLTTPQTLSYTPYQITITIPGEYQGITTQLTLWPARLKYNTAPKKPQPRSSPVGGQLGGSRLIWGAAAPPCPPVVTPLWQTHWLTPTIRQRGGGGQYPGLPGLTINNITKNIKYLIILIIIMPFYTNLIINTIFFI